MFHGHRFVVPDMYCGTGAQCRVSGTQALSCRQRCCRERRTCLDCAPGLGSGKKDINAGITKMTFHDDGLPRSVCVCVCVCVSMHRFSTPLTAGRD